jgi:DNA (cytosine-5)-methyltransferase 1
LPIPIIDIFAGPGGLGEGFSSRIENKERVFDIKLSIEKDAFAHKTLQLRSFYRKFPVGGAPDLYYDVLKESDNSKREELIEKLFDEYPDEAEEARNEAWCAELGSEKEEFQPEEVDRKIEAGLKGEKNWVLIGGPPCQAYSMAGRSRVGGISDEDHRVYLYKEYLRIIAKHHPAVFVMENVKGLLSAKVNGEKVFDWIKTDLQNPNSVFPGLDAPKYRIFSLSTPYERLDENGNPLYKKDSNYLIKAEKYGVPQKRHRVILLGVRQDVSLPEKITLDEEGENPLELIIGDLPELRSGVGRRVETSQIVNKKIKRTYFKEENSDDNWKKIVNNFRKEIISWEGFAKKYSKKNIKTPEYGIGSEYIAYKTPSEENPLEKWYKDPKDFQGACNHISRTHMVQDLKRYMFSSMFAELEGRFPRLHEFEEHGDELLPDHRNALSGNFADRFRVQLKDRPATTVTSHISKDGHYFIHYNPNQCRSLTVREAARIQTFPDNYLFCGPRTAQYHQVGNAVPPYLAHKISVIVYNIISRI